MHNGLSCRSLYIPGSFNVKKYCNYPGSGSSIFHTIYVLNNQYYNHLRYPRIFRSTGLAKMHHNNIARSLTKWKSTVTTFFFLLWKQVDVWELHSVRFFCKTLLYTSIVKEKLMRQKAYNTKMSDAHINEHIYMHTCSYLT